MISIHRVPAYRQIVDSLRVLLVDGSLAPDTQLPSVRRLAMESEFTSTRSARLSRVAAEGWIDLRHGRGATVVAAQSSRIGAPARVKEFRERLRNLVAEMRASGVPVSRIEAELRATGQRTRIMNSVIVVALPMLAFTGALMFLLPYFVAAPLLLRHHGATGFPFHGNCAKHRAPLSRAPADR